MPDHDQADNFSPEEQSLWKLLHDEQYDISRRLTWFCDGPEHGFIKGRVLARYLEEVTTATSPDHQSHTEGSDLVAPTPLAKHSSVSSSDEKLLPANPPLSAPTNTDEKLEQILLTVRDAGAQDDNIGAENWTYSDRIVEEAKRKIAHLIVQKQIEELEELDRHSPVHASISGKTMRQAYIENRIKELEAQLKGDTK